MQTKLTVHARDTGEEPVSFLDSIRRVGCGPITREPTRAAFRYSRFKVERCHELKRAGIDKRGLKQHVLVTKMFYITMYSVSCRVRPANRQTDEDIGFVALQQVPHSGISLGGVARSKCSRHRSERRHNVRYSERHINWRRSLQNSA